MTTHDPTTLNKQGADKGTQYRSVIFYRNEYQKEIAKKVIKNAQPFYDDYIVTEITPFSIFYEAEQEHQNYYKKHKLQRYCMFVISPKLSKLRRLHKNKLK